MLKHADVWRMIDALAEKTGMSPSGLAKKAGLDPTSFNPSKRIAGKRKRWPSTESIAAVLQATGYSLDDFIALANPEKAPVKTIPVINYANASREGRFDDLGKPSGEGWEEIPAPAVFDPAAFAIEVSGASMQPVYREGNLLIVSPTEKPRKGDRVLAKLNTGELMVKQLGRETSSKVELLSFNSRFLSLMISKRNIMWIYRIVWASQ